MFLRWRFNATMELLEAAKNGRAEASGWHLRKNGVRLFVSRSVAEAQETRGFGSRYGISISIVLKAQTIICVIASATISSSASHGSSSVACDRRRRRESERDEFSVLLTNMSRTKTRSRLPSASTSR